MCAAASTSKIYAQKKGIAGIAMPMKDQLETIMRTYLEFQKKSKEIQAAGMLEVMTAGVIG